MLNKKALAASVSAPPDIYPEDVFQTYLYTGTGASQTITNGVDLSGKGGMVWIKSRSGATWHALTDTVRGTTKSIASNSTNLEQTESTGLTAFSSTGFTIGSDADYNTNAATYCSWTFREQEKFFDVVTYTGNGSNRTIAHNLGSVPGMILVKRTDTTANWNVYHRSLGNTKVLYLNLTDTAQTISTCWNNTSPTSSQFTVGTDTDVNANGGTYVAYLFAHDDGGFGDAGTDNIISCGSFTTNSSGKTASPVSLGYEPQFVMIKSTSSTPTGGMNWFIYDTMRGFPIASGISKVLIANGTNAEADAQSAFSKLNITNTGFEAFDMDDNQTYIYMAIRRPMKTPTSGTSVFDVGQNRTSIANRINGTVGPIDLTLQTQVPAPISSFHFTAFDRLRGNMFLNTSLTDAESSGNVTFDTNVGVSNGSWFTSGGLFYNFRRATGFFDVVCYTGTGANRTITHNLGAVPELMIVKRRDTSGSNWIVYPGPLANAEFNLLYLDTTAALGSSSIWNNTAPTSSNFTVSTFNPVNASGGTYVAYLFATVAGVSKVGSYTGNGSTQTINCGFTAGARFVLIKRTDSTGDWYVWDTTRGIVSGNDPYLLLNSDVAEVTNTDYIDPANSGFEISSTAPAAINANGGSFIFMAIA